MQLAKMKKDAESKNIEYLQTIRVLAQNQKNLKEEVISKKEQGYNFI